MSDQKDYPTHYEVLDVDPSTPSDEIINRYHELRRAYDEQRISYSDPRYQMLNDAYRVLSNRWSRERYDNKLREEGLYPETKEIEEEDSTPDIAKTEVDTTEITSEVEEAVISLGELLQTDQRAEDEVETDDVESLSIVDPSQSDIKTHYEVLGISQDAPRGEVFSAYQAKKQDYDARRIPRNHPRFQALDDAFRVLFNDKQRANYDKSLRDGTAHQADTANKSKPVPATQEKPSTTRELTDYMQSRKTKEIERENPPTTPPASPNVKTHYDVLGISQDASRGDILNGYEAKKQDFDAQRISRTHPDYHALFDAYQILSNVRKRSEYDKFLRSENLYKTERTDAPKPRSQDKSPTTRELTGYMQMRQQKAKNPYHDRPSAAYRPSKSSYTGRPSFGDIDYGTWKIIIRIGIAVVALFVALFNNIDFNPQPSRSFNSSSSFRYSSATPRSIRSTPRPTLNTRQQGVATSTIGPTRTPRPTQTATLSHQQNADLFFANRNYLGAINHFENAIENSPNSPSLYYWRGLAYHRIYLAIVNSGSESPQLPTYLRNALSDYDYVIQETPIYAAPYRERGLLYFHRWQTDGLTQYGLSALEDLTRHVELVGAEDDEEVQSALATLQTASEELSNPSEVDEVANVVDVTSIAITSLGLNLDIHDSSLLQDEGIIELNAGNYDTAIDLFTRVIDTFPSAEVYLLRGRAHHALTLNPTLPTQLFDSAEFQLTLDDYALALELDPELYEVYQQRGLLYHSLCRMELERYCELSRDDLNFYLINVDDPATSVLLALQDLDTPFITPTVTTTPTPTSTPNPTAIIPALITEDSIYEVLFTFDRVEEMEAEVDRWYIEGYYEIALTGYSLLLEIAPSASLYYKRGLSYFDFAANAYDLNLELAKDDFDLALELDSDFYHAYRGRGFVRHLQCTQAERSAMCGLALQDFQTFAEAHGTPDEAVLQAMNDLFIELDITPTPASP